jgi:hypothetical protein
VPDEVTREVSIVVDSRDEDYEAHDDEKYGCDEGTDVNLGISLFSFSLHSLLPLSPSSFLSPSWIESEKVIGDAGIVVDSCNEDHDECTGVNLCILLFSFPSTTKNLTR